MKTNKSIQNHLYISFLSLVTLFTAGCGGTHLGNNGNIHIDPGCNQQRIISLTELNDTSSDTIWEKFFTQRGAQEMWNILQLREAELTFNFSSLTNPSENITQTADEIAAGIVRYLLYCYPVPIIALGLQGSDDVNKKLTSLPAEVDKFTSLQRLYLPLNNLTEIPHEIGNLTGLKLLNVCANNLTKISPKIDKLTNLQILNLSFNNLTEIPREVGDLVSLRTLDLSFNNFTEIPCELSKLTKLEKLAIEHNQLTKLPATIIPWLVSIEQIHAQHNPWLSPTDENLAKLNNFNADAALHHVRVKAANISLCTLLMWCIQNTIEAPEERKKVNEHLPQELSMEEQTRILKTHHKFFNDILCFGKIGPIDIPFYIDYQVANKTDINAMLVSLQGKQLYQIQAEQAEVEQAG
jgi:hypothetical protein